MGAVSLLQGLHIVLLLQLLVHGKSLHPLLLLLLLGWEAVRQLLRGLPGYTLNTLFLLLLQALKLMLLLLQSCRILCLLLLLLLDRHLQHQSILLLLWWRLLVLLLVVWQPLQLLLLCRQVLPVGHRILHAGLGRRLLLPWTLGVG